MNVLLFSFRILLDLLLFRNRLLRRRCVRCWIGFIKNLMICRRSMIFLKLRLVSFILNKCTYSLIHFLVGDAYMAITNLVKDQSTDHVKRAAAFSKDAIKAAAETLIDEDEPEKGYVRIRVGFHSGPVIADVIGSRLPKYGVFGDTVNTASRMESNSEAGRIHCSEVSATLLRAQDPDIRIIRRGNIKIKGKGEMVTYWIGDDM